MAAAKEVVAASVAPVSERRNESGVDDGERLGHPHIPPRGAAAPCTPRRHDAAAPCTVSSSLLDHCLLVAYYFVACLLPRALHPTHATRPLHSRHPSSLVVHWHVHRSTHAVPWLPVALAAMHPPRRPAQYPAISSTQDESPWKPHPPGLPSTHVSSGTVDTHAGALCGPSSSMLT